MIKIKKGFTMRLLQLSLFATLVFLAFFVIGNKYYSNQTGLKSPIKDVTIVRDTFLSASDKVALVIGNKNYTNHARLNNSINDAKLIKNTLKKMDYEVLEAYNLELDELDDKLDEFIKKAKKAKIAVIYYAGHGIGVNGKNYLIPLGTSKLSISRLDKKLTSVRELNEAVSNASEFGVVMFDACRNSFFNEDIKGFTSRGSRGLEQPTVKRPNILVSFSTLPNTIANDDVNNGNHGPYALALSENLNSNYDIRRVMGSVRARVSELTSDTNQPQLTIERNRLGGKQYCISGFCQEKVLKDSKNQIDSLSINKTKWIKPTNSVCRANSGEMKNGRCKANWENAKNICSASGGRLATEKELQQVVTDCGGIVNYKFKGEDWEKNFKNYNFQSCVVQKGFHLYGIYISSTNNSTCVSLGSGYTGYNITYKNADVHCIRLEE